MSLTWLPRKLSCDVIRLAGLEMNRMQNVPRSAIQTMTTLHRRRNYSTVPRDDDPSRVVVHHRPTNFDKRVLVFSKVYPSLDEVPEKVSNIQMTTARDWFRIRVSMLMAVATLFGCIFMIYSGKKAAREGNTVAKRNEERHRKWKEEEEKKAH